MITIYSMEPPPEPLSAYYRSYDAKAELRHGSVISLSSKWGTTVTRRTVAVPDLPTTRTYAAMTSTSVENYTSCLSVQLQGTDAIEQFGGTEDAVPLMLAEIKRMTGWSWERIARALGRTRQAVHGWTLGREIAQDNLEHLAKLRATIGYIDRGSIDDNRVLLNMATAEGRIVADLLDESRFEDVRALCGRGSGYRESSSVWAKKADQARSAEIMRKGHWFDELAETGGAEVAFEYVIPQSERRRVTVKRQG